jgi:hypothetical protein
MLVALLRHYHRHILPYETNIMGKALKILVQKITVKRDTTAEARREFFRRLNIPAQKGMKGVVFTITPEDEPRRRRSGVTPEKREAILSGIEQYYDKLRHDPAAWQKENDERKVWEATLRDGLPSS